MLTEAQFKDTIVLQAFQQLEAQKIIAQQAALLKQASDKIIELDARCKASEASSPAH